MTKSKFLLLMMSVMLINLSAQDLEVAGRAKITDMPTDDTAEQIVVKQSDGTLGVRAASTLSASSAGDYGTVVNPVTGKIWLDRNLGATRVATSSTDADSYGDLYQWGRAADGHELRSSTTLSGQAITWLADEGSNAWDGMFIVGSSNWLTSAAAATDLWSGTAAENNPCPSGFRVPTNAEWNQERRTWSSNTAAGAIASPLKLPMAGYRFLSDGSLSNVGSLGLYWSTPVSGSGARLLGFHSSDADGHRRSGVRLLSALH